MEKIVTFAEKDSQKSLLKMKIIEKLKIITIKQITIEMQERVATNLTN